MDRDGRSDGVYRHQLLLCASDRTYSSISISHCQLVSISNLSLLIQTSSVGQVPARPRHAYMHVFIYRGEGKQRGNLPARGGCIIIARFMLSNRILSWFAH